MTKKIAVIATIKWVNDWPNNRPATWLKLFRQAGEAGKIEEVPNTILKPLASWTTQVMWDEIDASSPKDIDYIFSVETVDFEGNWFIPAGYKKIEEGLSVVNIYQPNPITTSIQLERSKVLFDSDLELGEFDFELVDGISRLISKGRPDEYGLITFDSITFTEMGSYEFSVILINKMNRNNRKISNVTIDVSYVGGNLFTTTSYIQLD